MVRRDHITGLKTIEFAFSMTWRVGVEAWLTFKELYLVMKLSVLGEDYRDDYGWKED